MTAYVAAGYIAVFGTLSMYSASLILRARQAAAKVTTVETLLDKRVDSGQAAATPTNDPDATK
jgi:hypothetical protein